MQEDCITKLVNIQGFSVKKTIFSGSEGDLPEVRIYLEREEKRYCCSGCKQYYSTYYDSKEHAVKDLPYGKWKKAYLLFDKVRVGCNKCGVTVEALEWVKPWGRLTKRLEEEVARECRLIQSIRQVSKRFHLHWEIVKEIDREYLKKELNPPNFDDLEYLVIDEIAIKKRHKYATVVVDALRRKVLWVVEDRTKESLEEFYRVLGEEGCKRIKAVAMDMWKAYEEVTRRHCPQAEIVYDQFHIIQNYGKVIDEIRIEEMRKANEGEKEVFKGTKYLLLSNRENIDREDHVKLSELLSLNKRLNTAYVLKDDLKHLWDYTYEGRAESWFREWYKRAIYSHIEPLKRFARSLKAHIGGILARCRYKINTSLLEGMNNKIKVIKRVAFGFRDMEYFFLKVRGAFGGT